MHGPSLGPYRAAQVEPPGLFPAPELRRGRLPLPIKPTYSLKWDQLLKREGSPDESPPNGLNSMLNGASRGRPGHLIQAFPQAMEDLTDGRAAADVTRTRLGAGLYGRGL
ncbi:hypothetical protein GCM10023074_51120 [Microbispora amethystogenes]|uniref:Uncharacterized protein n=1 Tax=Microbispora amethystogenes TaxID=1427754 RepID=A0ABQ4FH17_9ACTN|nr:hypothetical protein Mam01_42860 [Microbispora amethystogenes]